MDIEAPMTTTLLQNILCTISSSPSPPPSSYSQSTGQYSAENKTGLVLYCNLRSLSTPRRQNTHRFSFVCMFSLSSSPPPFHNHDPRPLIHHPFILITRTLPKLGALKEQAGPSAACLHACRPQGRASFRAFWQWMEVLVRSPTRKPRTPGLQEPNNGARPGELE